MEPTIPSAAGTRIGFSTPKTYNPISAFIRKVTRSKASHAWILYFDEDFEQDMVIEAHSTGFRLVSLKAFAKTNRIVAVYQPRKNIDAGLKAAGDWLGIPYDYPGLFGMAVVMLGRWLKRKWQNPLRNKRQMFCSEAVVRMLQAVNYPGADKLDAESTDPWRIRDLLHEDGSALLEGAAMYSHKALVADVGVTAAAAPLPRPTIREFVRRA